VSVGRILVIGLNTFREAIRNKVLYSLLFFALLVIVASYAFGALSVHEEVRLTTDLGLAGMSLFSILIAVFVGVNLLYKELERKTIYSLVPKPIYRSQLVLGKFLGMLLTITVLVAVMAAVLSAVLALRGSAPTEAVAKTVVLIYLEVAVVTAVALLFSSFSTPFLSGLFTVGVFLLGRSVPDIRLVASKLESAPAAFVVRAIARIIPNLRYFYTTGTEAGGAYVSVHASFPDWSYVGLAAGYAALYIAVILALSVLLFSRRDFV
jgi:ABC-type transport system involved in multi-copper enzyme maturation permease subunit